MSHFSISRLEIQHSVTDDLSNSIMTLTLHLRIWCQEYSQNRSRLWTRYLAPQSSSKHRQSPELKILEHFVDLARLDIGEGFLSIERFDGKDTFVARKSVDFCYFPE